MTCERSAADGDGIACPGEGGLAYRFPFCDGGTIYVAEQIDNEIAVLPAFNAFSRIPSLCKGKEFFSCGYALTAQCSDEFDIVPVPAVTGLTADYGGAQREVIF